MTGRRPGAPGRPTRDTILPRLLDALPIVAGPGGPRGLGGVGHRLRLERRGRGRCGRARWRGRCPACADPAGGLVVTGAGRPGRFQRARCSRCGFGGDAVDVLAALEGATRRALLAELPVRLGLVPPPPSPPPPAPADGEEIGF